MTASLYDEPLSALGEHVENIAAWLAVWKNRKEPGAHARHCASDAMDAIDAAFGELHEVRARPNPDECYTSEGEGRKHQG